MALHSVFCLIRLMTKILSSIGFSCLRRSGETELRLFRFFPTPALLRRKVSAMRLRCTSLAIDSILLMT